MITFKNIYLKLFMNVFGLIFTLDGMEKPETFKTFQPASLTLLSASALAKSIDPGLSPQNALTALGNTHKIPENVAPLISHALFERHQNTLRTILKSQPPINLNIERLPEIPTNLFSLTGHGIYSRSKKDMCNAETGHSDPLYAGIAQLAPDPLIKNAPYNFFQVYSQRYSNVCFDDTDDARTLSANSPLIGIWDKRTGTLLNDGKEIQKKLLAKYPQISEHDAKLPLFFLQGISSDDSVAWCRFLYCFNHKYIEGACGFIIKNNEIIFESIEDLELNPLSPDGNFATLSARNSSTIIQTKSGEKLVSYSDLEVKGFGPLDDYMLVKFQTQGHGELLCCNFKTKEIHNLNLSISNGRYDQLNSDGALIATAVEFQIFVLNMFTNKIVCTFPAPDMEEDDTYYSPLFSPDSKQLLVLKVKNAQVASYHLWVYTIANQELVEELTSKEIIDGDNLSDFIFCNEGNYLLFPNGQLRIQPRGLANHLSLTELLGLLILEQQKATNMPLCESIVTLLQQNEFPILKDLFKKRYLA